MCVRGVARAGGGRGRELNSLVLTHIDIKFTAMLSFIQVAINLFVFSGSISAPRDIFTGGSRTG